jgi:hypothetical protein
MLRASPTRGLVEDVKAGYFDELVHVRQTLDSRYDDVKSGKSNLCRTKKAKHTLTRN